MHQLTIGLSNGIKVMHVHEGVLRELQSHGKKASQGHGKTNV